jgi:hypothetical protein
MAMGTAICSSLENLITNFGKEGAVGGFLLQKSALRGILEEWLLRYKGPPRTSRVHCQRILFCVLASIFCSSSFGLYFVPFISFHGGRNNQESPVLLNASIPSLRSHSGDPPRSGLCSPETGLLCPLFSGQCCCFLGPFTKCSDGQACTHYLSLIKIAIQ